jgi:hypothetical protein
LFIFINTQSHGACGATTLVWNGSNSTWDNTSNWTPNGIPDTSSENATVTAIRNLIATNATISCLEVQSGLYLTNNSSNNETLTVTGDYFKNLSPNTMRMRNRNNFTIDMAGTTEQDLSAVDPLTHLVISNSTTVNITEPGIINRSFTITGAGTTVNLSMSGEWKTNQDVTIPAGTTVIIANGASWRSQGNITVDGVLKVQAGGTIILRNGRNINVNSGSIMQVNGASGNASTIKSEGSARYFRINVFGSFSANFFRFDGLRDAGLRIQNGGTLSSLNNGEFRNGRSSVDYITLESGSSAPTSMTGIGFYDDDGLGNLLNFDAANYGGSIISMTNYSGDVGGPTFENDPSNLIDWGTIAPTTLSLISDTPRNNPGNSLAASSGARTFGIFAATLTAVDTNTDITSLTISLSGTASAADIEFVQLFQDTDGNCAFNNGTDTQIGSDQTLSGLPATTTFTIPAGQIQTSGPSDRGCFIVRAGTSAIAEDGKTIKLGIESNTHVINSQNYNFSQSSGPPVYGNQTVINSGTQAKWKGTTDDRYTLNNNWLGNAPTSGNNLSCEIGAGTNVTRINSTPVQCKNASFLSTGTLDFDNASNTINITGSLTVSSGFVFQNATSGPGVIAMAGSTNQNFSLGESFPGNVNINNSGASGSDTISVVTPSFIGGDLTISNGRLEISSNKALTVLGNITVLSGAELSIKEGAQLIMGNGSVLTVNSGGGIFLLGVSGSPAQVKSLANGQSIQISINGNISANHYSFSNLGGNGLSVESGATIDGTNHFQNGSFIFPEGSNPTLFSLKQSIPGNSLDNMLFDLNGSGATGVTNINTTGASAGTLTINGYSGDLSGPSFDTDPSYTINWTGATNTIEITQDQTGPSTIDQGSNVTMGRFRFIQSQAGASFLDANVTSLTLTLLGTASAGDIEQAKVYFDSDCDSTGGTLIGTQSFSGNPAKASFSFSGTELSIPADPATPSPICAYVVFEVASNATAGAKAGILIQSSSDIVNDQSYALSASTPAPINLGAPATIASISNTIWTGSANTNWFNSSNWSHGIPSSTINCEIDDQANDPVISSGTASCSNLNINSGSVDINSSATLEFSGNFTNQGTITGLGTLRLVDTLAAAQTMSFSSTLPNLSFNKPNGGTVHLIGTTMTVNGLDLATGNDFDLIVAGGKTLILPNGIDISSAKFHLSGGSVLQIGAGQSVTVTGGQFIINGTADSWPQSLNNKGTVNVQGGSGTWSFSASSGDVYLKGFILDSIDTSGVNLSGSTNLLRLEGGQFTNLSSSFASVKAIQLNHSGSLPTIADKVYWTWGNANDEGTDTNSDGIPDPPTPANTENYQLVSSSGCGNKTIDFTNWTGDWFESAETFDVDTKISATNCNINMSSAASAVDMLSLTATPYNGAVDIRWVTRFESDHLGFNVYRANPAGTEFIQVNPTLIYNFNNSGGKNGSYRFIDSDVTNGAQYFYYIQDVETDRVTTELHGPVLATPLSSLSTPPADDPGQNSGGNSDDSDPATTQPGSIVNPSFKDLGDGTVILSQTSSGLRLQITPEAPVFSTSAWDNSYQDVSVLGHSQTMVVGHPQLPVRDYLIEVNSFSLLASATVAEKTETTLAGHLITPSPDWTPDGSGVLQPSFSPDGTVYSSGTTNPSTYYDLTTQLISLAGRKYLKLKIHPLKYNPVTQDIERLTKLVLDIGLDGDAWRVSPDPTEENLIPELVSNTLKVEYTQAGLYQVDYADLLAHNLLGPFTGINPENIRAHYHGSEIALKVIDSDQVFNSGDTIRFYAPFHDSLDSSTDNIILSPSNILFSANSPLRMSDISAAPSISALDGEEESWFEINLEENDYYFTEESIGDSGDHFFWERLFSYTGMDTLDFSTSITNIINDADKTVQVQITVKPLKSFFNNDGAHHLELYINDMTEPAGDQIFAEGARTTLTFQIDGDHFTTGTNNFRLKITGSQVPAGDYEVLYIDKVNLRYLGGLNALNDQVKMSAIEEGFNYQLQSFTTNNLLLFDITNPLAPKEMTSPNITTSNAGASYDMDFYIDNFEGEEHEGTLLAVETQQILTPSKLSLTSGAYQSLKDSSIQADYLVIGQSDLLLAASNLISHRESQGLSVKTANLTQIYAEFGHGQKSASAIRDFILSTQSNWQSPIPKYVLLLGDGTYNPKGHEIDNFDGDPISNADEASGQKATIPLRSRIGQFWDFADDHFFVTNDSTSLPQLAIGRLPTNSPDAIYRYGQKVIAYESGNAAPTNLKKAVFIADIDTDNEKFNQRISSLSNLESWSTINFENSKLQHSDFPNTTNMTTEINSHFADTPLLINFLGHGATGQWGDEAFMLSDISALSNDRYPIVMALNCDNAYFYNEDLNDQSMAESFIFKEDAGAIAFLGTMSWTTPPAQQRMAQNFYGQLTSVLAASSYNVRLGEIFQQAKVALGEDAYHRDIQRSFTLIGDPALKLPQESFNEALAIETPLPASAQASDGGGGCSLGADPGRASLPWYSGLLEWALLLLSFLAMRGLIFRKEKS